MCVVFTTSAIYLYCIAYKRVCSLYLFASLQASTHLISRHTLLGSLGADSVCPVDNPAIFFKNCGSQNGSIVLLIYLFFLAAVCIWNLKKKQLWMSKTHAQEAQGCQRNNPIFSLQVTENYTHGEHIKGPLSCLVFPTESLREHPRSATKLASTRHGRKLQETLGATVFLKYTNSIIRDRDNNRKKNSKLAALLNRERDWRPTRAHCWKDHVGASAITLRARELC